MKLHSIRARILIWLSLLFLVLAFSLGILINREMKRVMFASVDAHLQAEIRLLRGILGEAVNVTDSKLVEAETGEHTVPLSGHYYQISTNDGQILARSPSLSLVGAFLPLTEDSNQTSPYSQTTGPGLEPLRMLTRTLDFPSGTITIQVAESIEEVNSLLHSFRLIICFSLLTFFVFFSIGVAVILHFCLSRLTLFTTRIQRIYEKNLTERVDEKNLDQELVHLARSFNTMMERLEESFGRQRRFLSDASHDLKTPLTLIKSTCDVTLRKPRDVEEYISTLKTISGTTLKMTNRVQRILAMSRLDDMATSSRQDQVELLTMLGEIIRNFQAEAEQKGISISLTGEKTHVTCDRERLQDLLSNIIDNAIKYNHESGTVSLSVKTVGNEAVIICQDSGIGMTNEEMSHVFERLYRADKSRSRVAGDGLGLAISKAIVEMYGGRITVQSKLDRGSTFSLFLPIDK